MYCRVLHVAIEGGPATFGGLGNVATQMMLAQNKFKIDEKGAIINYEESFWTFKMKPGELEKKFSTLFRDYIEGKDLSKYQSQNIKEEWIEFPDQNYFYDRKEQKWKAIGQL